MSEGFYYSGDSSHKRTLPTTKSSRATLPVPKSRKVTQRDKSCAKQSSETATHNGELPHGWSWKSVGELAAKDRNSITDGPFGSKLKTSHYTDVGPRVIRLTNIGNGEFVDAHAHISDAHFSTLKKHRIFAGDIVIAALGETLPRACLIPESVGAAIVKADCIRFAPSEEHSAKFLNYALNWEGTQKRTASIVHGVGRPRLNLSEIKSILLPVPELAEQRRIVAEIEKQFTRLDAGVAALKRVQANLKRYRAAVLKAACEGRLVPTEAELARNSSGTFESASRLLDRIRNEKAKKVEIGEMRKPRRDERHFLENCELALPEGWAQGCVADFGAPEDNAIVDGPFGSNLKLSDYDPDGTYPVITITNIDEGFNLDLLRKVTAQKYAELKRSAVRPGDLVVAKIGSSYGKTGVYPNYMPTGIIPANLLKVTPSPEQNWKYLFYHLKSLSFKTHLDKIVQFTAQPAFNVSKFKLLPVPTPPFLEQNRIVSEIERRLSVVDELEAVVTANLKRAARLRQSILQKAFTGQL